MRVRHWLLKNTKINTGGLMRCCTATISEYATEHQEEMISDRTVIDCKYEKEGNKNIIIKDNVWQWNKPSA